MPDEIRNRLVALGWIRVRSFNKNDITITASKPKEQYKLIKKFLEDNGFEIKKTIINIDDLNGNYFDSLFPDSKKPPVIKNTPYVYDAQNVTNKNTKLEEFPTETHENPSTGDEKITGYTVVFDKTFTNPLGFLDWYKLKNEIFLTGFELSDTFKGKGLERKLFIGLHNKYPELKINKGKIFNNIKASITLSNRDIYKTSQIMRNYDYGISFTDRLLWFNRKRNKRKSSLEKIVKANLPTLLFLVGIPASGKSTFVSTVKDNYIIVSPDEIRKELTGNISDQTKNKEVWDLAKKRVNKALSSGDNVILDATNVSSNNRKRFVLGLPPHKLQAKIFNSDPETSYKRIQEDLKNGKSRSDVPLNAIHNMFNNFNTQSKPEQLQEEGFELL